MSTAVLSVPSVLTVPPTPPPASLKREMLLVELMEHFIPFSHPAESAALQTERRVKEGEREEEMKEHRKDGGDGEMMEESEGEETRGGR